MTAVMSVEIEGKRIEIDPAETNWQTRCDACGEFTASGDAVRIQIHISYQGALAVPVTLDLHRSCAPALDWHSVIGAAVMKIAGIQRGS